MKNNNHKYKVWNPKKYLILFICLILFYFSFIATTVSISESLTLKVGIYENSPKIFTDDKGNALGFWPDIIEYIALQEGWQIEWVCCIWSQCMEKLENNEIDLMPDVSFTEPRSKRYTFSQETVLTSWTRIYARKGANIQSILDLKGKKIGVMTGSVNFTGLGGIKELTENFDLDCTFVEMNNYTEVFEALEKGEIDIGVTNKDFGNKYEKDFDIDKTSIIFRPSHVQFAFPKNSSLTPYLLERVDYHMKELKKSKDGIYYQSLEKWLAVEVGEREVIPEWINWLLVGIGGIALLFFGVNIILRSQVRSKTKELRRDITERKVAEEELKKTTELLQSVMDNATDEAIITTDQIGIILIWNEGARRLLGYESEEIVGRESIRIFHTEEYLKSGIMDVNIKKMITMGKPLVKELDYVTKDGKIIPVQEIVSPRFDGDGKFIGMVGMARDITERKQAEEELLIKNEVFEASITGNSILDNKGILTYVNSAFIKIFGYENKEEAVGKPISDFLKFEDEAMNIITALNKTGVWEGEYTGLKKDGSTFTAYGLATTIKDKSGDSIGYQSAVLDISDRKRIDESLRESEEKYSSVVENSLDGIIVLQKGIIKFLNQAILDLIGYNLEELIDKEFESLLSPEYRQLIMDRYRARLAGKETPSIYEIEVIRKDGISVPIEVSNTTIIYGGEKATLSFIRNITERKKAEKDLRESEEKFSKSFYEHPTPMGIVNIATGERSDVNNSYLKLMGGDYNEAAVGNMFKKNLAFNQNRFKELISMIQKKGSISNEYFQMVKKSGEIITTLVSAVKLDIGDGNTTIISFIDITEREETQRQLKESEEKYRELVDSTKDGIMIADSRGKISFANTSYAKMLGYKKPKELIGKQVDKLYTHPEQRKEMLKQLTKEGFIKDLELELDKKDGSTIYTSSSVTIKKDKYGKIIQTEAIVRDVTNRKKAEDALRESEARLNKAQHIAQIGSWELDLIASTLYWSDEVYRMFDLKPQQFSSTYEVFLDNIHPDDRAFVDKAYTESVKNKTPYDIVHRLLLKDGTLKFVNERCKTFYDDAGKALRSIGTIQDITVRKQIQERLKKTMNATIDTMSNMIEAKDPYTSGHQHRVCQLAVPLARELGLAEDKIEGIRIATLIHDIGKIGLPTEILSKPGKLTDIEFGLIKDHSQIGYDILKSIDFSYPVANIVLQHHEKIDGSGYPNKLKGDKILLEAKIIGVADVVEAMSSHRPYRPALGIDVALEEISKNRGILYDPEIADACLKLFKEKGFKFKREAKRKGIIQRTVF